MQTTVLRVLAYRGTRPDLLIAVLVPFSLGVPVAQGFVVGLVLGAARDLFSLEPFGLSAGVFALLGCLVARLRTSVFGDHPLTHAVLALLCSAVSSAASVAAMAIQGAEVSAGAFAGQAAVSAVGTAILSGLVGAVAWWRPRWFGLRRRLEFDHV
jgi:rod shape-determining protein MreD